MLPDFPMTLTTWVGIIAGCLTTASFLPQALKTVRTRSTQDFSWPYLTLFSIGVLLWDIYGVLRQDVAVVVANTITLALVLVIVAVKIFYPPQTKS
jgi:MtN3 and saliva related transmembrane protein